MKKIAVINDLSGLGRCSLTAALPIISAHGIQACPLPTGIFSNQTDYESYYTCDFTAHMPPYIAEWRRRQVRFDAILTGFIPNGAQGSIVSDFIATFRSETTLLAVDPVMGDNGVLYKCYTDETIAAIRALAAQADFITPNETELALLCGREPQCRFTLKEIEEMSRMLKIPMVITTGIKLTEETIANAVWDGEQFHVIRAHRFAGSFSGTGDIFTAYVLADYLKNGDIVAAVSNASAFLERAIRQTPCRSGEDNLYHADGVEFETLLQIK